MECSRCGGSGKIKKFNHVDGGICWECNGKGYSLAKGEIMIEFLDEGKNIIGRLFCTGDTKQSVVRAKGKEIGAKTMRAKRGLKNNCCIANK